MLQIQICFSYFVLSISSGLLAVPFFHRLNWKYQTSFNLMFSKTIPRSHRYLYQTVSAPINLRSFAKVTASIINALLCLAKYSLLDKTVHPATSCSTVSALLIFRLVCFDSHLFSTLLKRYFYSFPCRFPLLFDPLTIQLYRVVSNFNPMPTSFIVVLASVTTAFSTFNISLFGSNYFLVDINWLFVIVKSYSKVNVE